MALPVSLSTSGNAVYSRGIPIGWTQLQNWQWLWAQANAETLTKPVASIQPLNQYYAAPLNSRIRRIILFFDTTGITEDVILRLLVSVKSGSGSIYLLNGNGADYDFGAEIYGWITGRYSSEYVIATKTIASTTASSYTYFPVPASHVNSSGYTVLILVHSADYEYSASPTGYLTCTTDCTLRLPSKGYIWIEGTSVAYIDASEAKRTKEGTLDGATGQTAGHIWIEGDNFRYIDSSGDERYILGSAGAASSQTAGHIWFEGSELHYIDSSGNERYFEGS